VLVEHTGRRRARSLRRLLVDVAPLRESPHFRRLWLSQMMASLGTQITVTTAGLEAYAISGSTLAVGGIGLSALFPIVAMGLWGGALADRFDRKRLALAACAVMAAAAAGLTAQAFGQLKSVALLYGLVAVMCGADAVNASVRGAMIPRLVEPRHLTACNALAAMSQAVGIMVGPVVAALVVDRFDFGPAYGLHLAALVVAIHALWRLPSVRPQVAAGRPAQSSLRATAEGMAFVWRNPVARLALGSDLCLTVLSWPRAAYPAIATVIIGGGEITVGLLTASLAVGCVLASLFSGPLTRVVRQGRTVILAVAVWGLAMFAFGVVLLAAGRHHPPRPLVWAMAASAVALAAAGACDTVAVTLRGTIVTAVTPDWLRGRLWGVFVVIGLGVARSGDIVVGVDSHLWGEAVAVMAGGLACTAAIAGLTAWIGRPLWRYRAAPETLAAG
jgi:MFS family permease